MAKHEYVEYTCEKCERKLKRHSPLNIVTSLSENGYWSRLHIRIEHRHGMHNDGTTEQADLCKACVTTLLEDALDRVRKGERATAGTEEIEQVGWDR